MALRPQNLRAAKCLFYSCSTGTCNFFVSLIMSTILVLRNQNSFKLEAYNLPFKVAIATGLTSSHPEQSS